MRASSAEQWRIAMALRRLQNFGRQSLALVLSSYVLQPEMGSAALRATFTREDWDSSDVA